MHISLLLLPNLMPSSLFSLQDVLAIAGLMQGEDWALARVSLDGQPVEAFQGTSLTVDARLAAIAQTDLLFVPSLMLDGDNALENPALAGNLQRLAKGGTHMASVCTGAFALASAGLLDGRAATTHWLYQDAFRRRFPAVQLLPERVMVDDGPVMTAAAGMAWQDLLLAVLAPHVDEAVMLQLRQMFLLQTHNAGQKPYIGISDAPHNDAVIRKAQQALAADPAHRQALELAQVASGLQLRTFQRRFRQAAGCTAVQYLQQLRMEKAKSLLLSGRLPVEQVGFATGYDDGSFFRRLFRRHTGLSPSEYRKRYRLPDQQSH